MGSNPLFRQLEKSHFPGRIRNISQTQPIFQLNFALFRQSDRTRYESATNQVRIRPPKSLSLAYIQTIYQVEVILKNAVMAKYKKNNPLTNGASGKIGDNVVLKKLGDTQYLANKGGKRKKSSEKQLVQMDRFSLAIWYANRQIVKPERRALYEKGIDGKKRHAHAVAMSDYLNVPVIHGLDVNDYHGEPGGMIRVRATDDFRVATVSVTIKGPDGQVIEAGMATPRGKRGLWRMATTARNSNLAGSVVEVVATDYASNSAAENVIIGAATPSADIQRQA